MHTVMAESGLEKASQDRRSNSRKRVGLLQMVNLGAENGGLMLDLSEGGLALHAVYPVAPEPEIPINFLLPNTDIRIEAKAQVAWGGHSKQVGLQFTDMPASTLQQVRDWLNSTPQFDDVFAEFSEAKSFLSATFQSLEFRTCSKKNAPRYRCPEGCEERAMVIGVGEAIGAR